MMKGKKGEGETMWQMVGVLLFIAVFIVVAGVIFTYFLGGLVTDEQQAKNAAFDLAQAIQNVEYSTSSAGSLSSNRCETIDFDVAKEYSIFVQKLEVELYKETGPSTKTKVFAVDYGGEEQFVCVPYALGDFERDGCIHCRLDEDGQPAGLMRWNPGFKKATNGNYCVCANAPDRYTFHRKGLLGCERTLPEDSSVIWNRGSACVYDYN